MPGLEIKFPRKRPIHASAIREMKRGIAQIACEVDTFCSFLDFRRPQPSRGGFLFVLAGMANEDVGFRVDLQGECGKWVNIASQ